MEGNEIIKELSERNYPITEFIPVASERSVGKKLSYQNKEYTIVGLSTAVEMQPNIALFSE